MNNKKNKDYVCRSKRQNYATIVQNLQRLMIKVFVKKPALENAYDMITHINKYRKECSLVGETLEYAKHTVDNSSH